VKTEEGRRGRKWKGKEEEESERRQEERREERAAKEREREGKGKAREDRGENKRGRRRGRKDSSFGGEKFVENATLTKVKNLVPGFFVPKTFRSQERIVPMGNFRSWERKVLGTKGL